VILISCISSSVIVHWDHIFFQNALLRYGIPGDRVNFNSLVIKIY